METPEEIEERLENGKYTIIGRLFWSVRECVSVRGVRCYRVRKGKLC